MRLLNDRLTASPTDLANFLACRHKTALDRLAAAGRLTKPHFVDPLADMLRERGKEHERRYVDELRAQGLTVADLGGVERDAPRAQTLEAMRDGADVIVQAVLADDQWLGYADVLRRVSVPQSDVRNCGRTKRRTRSSRARRAAAPSFSSACTPISSARSSGSRPSDFHVVTPLADRDRIGSSDLRRLLPTGQVEVPCLHRCDAGRPMPPEPYPEPVDHCAVCRWSSRCNARRRSDDHLSFVAGLGRTTSRELAATASRRWRPGRAAAPAPVQAGAGLEGHVRATARAGATAGRPAAIRHADV